MKLAGEERGGEKIYGFLEDNAPAGNDLCQTDHGWMDEKYNDLTKPRPKNDLKKETQKYGGSRA